MFVFLLPVMYAARQSAVPQVHQMSSQPEFKRRQFKTPQHQWANMELLTYPRVDTSVPPPKIPTYHRTMPSLEIAMPALEIASRRHNFPPPRLVKRDQNLQYRSACCTADFARARPPNSRPTPNGWSP